MRLCSTCTYIGSRSMYLKILENSTPKYIESGWVAPVSEFLTHDVATSTIKVHSSFVFLPSLSNEVWLHLATLLYLLGEVGLTRVRQGMAKYFLLFCGPSATINREVLFLLYITQSLELLCTVHTVYKYMYIHLHTGWHVIWSWRWNFCLQESAGYGWNITYWPWRRPHQKDFS